MVTMSKPTPVKQRVRIKITGIPPVKKYESWGNKDNTKRKKILREEALRIAQDRPYLFYGETRLKIKVVYSRYKGKLDGANNIGGIADILEGVFYGNDRQLVEIRYKEVTPKSCRKDSYIITLSHE